MNTAAVRKIDFRFFFNHWATSAGRRLVSLIGVLYVLRTTSTLILFTASTALLPVFDRKGNEATRFIVHLRIKPTETARLTEE